MNEYVTILYNDFFNELDKRLACGKVIVAIEGGSASGKSTLADILSKKYDCTVFHMDDFFLRPEQRTINRYKEVGGNIDKERFIEEVLPFLKNGKKINYHKFDCSAMSLGDVIEVIPKKLMVIEGVYSMHPEFGRYYDFSLFLDIDTNKQKDRIIKRNTLEIAKRFFNEWIPLENEYFSKTNVISRCDMVIKINM